MAREQRKDVDYFPHDCTHGRKMHIIETKYGNDGYAAWFKLLEQLGKANNHYIDISDDMTLMFLTSVFRINEEKTLSILTDLSKLGAIDKFLFDEHKVIFSPKFTESIQDAYRKRKLKCFEYSDVLDEIKRKNNQTDGSLNSKQLNPREIDGSYPQSKVEYSKVKESKEEKNLNIINVEKSTLENSEEKKDDLLENPKPKKEKKVAPKKENNHWAKMVEVWFDFYKLKFECEPSFDATQGKHLKSILSKFQRLAKKKDLEDKKEFDWNEDRAIRTLQRFLENAWIDNWLQQHFLLKNLISNFDAIINKKPIGDGKSNNSGGTAKKQFVFSAQSIIDKTKTG